MTYEDSIHLGEFNLIRRFFMRESDSQSPKIHQSEQISRVLLGIGDDCALLCHRRARWTGNDSQHPQLVRRSSQTIMDAARLDFRAGVVGALPQYGRRRLVGLAAG